MKSFQEAAVSQPHSAPAQNLAEERLRMAMEAAKIGTFDWNMATGEIYWSPNLEEATGLPPGGFERTFEHFNRLVHPEDRSRVHEAVQQALRSRSLYEVEFRMVRPDQSVRWVHAKAQFHYDESGTPVRMVGIDIDITAYKDTEQQLRLSQMEARARAQDLAAILDAVPAMTFIARDRECRQMTSSRATYEMLRMTPGKNPSKTADEEERPTHFTVLENGREVADAELPLQQAALTGREIRNRELRIVFKDGSYCDILGNAIPLTGEDGEPSGALGAFVDITERKRAEEELRKSEARIRRFVRSSPIGIVAAGAERGIFDANDVFLEMLGYSREEFFLRRRTWQDFTPPEFLPAAARVLEELKSSGTFVPFETEYFRKDGSRVPVIVGGAAISESPLEWMRFVLDLTEHRRAEALKVSETLQRQLLEREVLACEAERSRIARELHDEAGQTFASLLAGLRAIEDAGTLSKARSLAKQLRAAAGRGIEEVARIAHGLHPLAFNDLGLVAALRNYLSEFSHLHGILTELKVSGLDSDRLPAPVEAGFMRIIQEALTNTSKHAKAHSVTVAIELLRSKVTLSIADDGCGFDVEKKLIPSHQHLGLQGMRERISMLGGQFFVRSSIDGGTIISAQVSLPQIVSA